MNLWLSLPSSRIPALPAPITEPLTTYRVATRRSTLLRDCYARIPGWGDCAIVIRRGFEYDGPTLPRVALPFIAHRDLSALAPLVHDFIYEKEGQVETLQGSKLNLTRAEADEIFHRLMLQQAVTPWKAHAAYNACRLFGQRWWGDIWVRPSVRRWLLSRPMALLATVRRLKTRIQARRDQFPSTAIPATLGGHLEHDLDNDR